MDTLASEYGWTAEYILKQVYPAQAFSLLPKVARRHLNAFVDALEIQILTKHDIKSDDKNKWLAQVDRMRTGAETAPPERPFDRQGMEKLREVMNAPRKGRGPQRAK